MVVASRRRRHLWQHKIFNNYCTGNGTSPSLRSRKVRRPATDVLIPETFKNMRQRWKLKMINYLVHFVHSYPPPRTAPSCPRRSASSWLSAPTSTFGCNPEIDNFDKCLFISAMFNSHTEWLNIQFIVMLMSMLPGCQIIKNILGTAACKISREIAREMSLSAISQQEKGESEM